FEIHKRLEKFDEILESSLRNLRVLADVNGQSLFVEKPEKIPPIELDAGRIEQVLSNIVGNAIKFTPKNGHIKLKLKLSDQELLIAVSDDGPGIASDQLLKIFDKFWQAPSAKQFGMGLGMTIAKGIILAHGGRIWVQSELGKGTKFYFTITLSKT
ncbi:MAG: ATP-binding protein, partial [Bdellovibrionales bacterium]|nr:ATP-binding protein [Bdellovibrionales bacterium]